MTDKVTSHEEETSTKLDEGTDDDIIVTMKGL